MLQSTWRKLRDLRAARPAVGRDRSQKAKMIEAILEDYCHAPLRGCRILDIGCGNGGISQYLARQNDVYAVDIGDRRRPENMGFSFTVVHSERLPFEDSFFDFVASHHVIEHVRDQALHLDEIRRVLKPSGACYLATPNRTSPFMGGHVGNDLVLCYRDMAGLFVRHGFRVTEYAHRVLLEPETFHGEVRFGRHLPLWLALLARPLYPSHMFALTPADEPHARTAPTSRASSARV